MTMMNEMTTVATNHQERTGASPPVSSDQHVPNRRVCAQPLLRWVLPTLLLAILLALPTTATAQIWIDGEEQSGDTYTNYDEIDTAIVSNYYDPVFGTYGYWVTCELINHGMIADATAHFGGTMYNGGEGFIQTANVYGNYVDGEYVYTGFQSFMYNGYYGTGSIETANVHLAGFLYNGYYNGYSGSTGYITTANIDGGWLYNGYAGFIKTANINGGGSVHSTGFIETVNVHEGVVVNGSSYDDTAFIKTANIKSGKSGDRYSAKVYNGSGGVGSIETANVDGYLVNGSHFGTGYITTVNVNSSGTAQNGDCDGGTGFIETANINGGTLYNGNGHPYYDFYDGTGLITTANVNSGTLYNGYGHWRGTGFITTANVYGGTVFNQGRIDNMTYFGGTYNGWGESLTSVVGYDEYWNPIYGTRINFGSIGTLTLAGNSADNTGDWGNIEHLQFANDGSGILTISAALLSSRAQVGSIDFTYGNVALDLTGIAPLGDDWITSLLEMFEDEFSFALIFRESEITGVSGLKSFSVGWGNEWFWILDDGMFISDDWSFTATGLAYFPNGGNEVPEPATLAIIGLGLAGLGFARRRK